MRKKIELKPGNIIEQNGERIELIERQPSWREDDIPFCVGTLEHDRQVCHARQRWKVNIDGWVTHRYIEYFYKIGHVSANCKAWFKASHIDKEPFIKIQDQK